MSENQKDTSAQIKDILQKPATRRTIVVGTGFVTAAGLVKSLLGGKSEQTVQPTPTQKTQPSVDVSKINTDGAAAPDVAKIDSVRRPTFTLSSTATQTPRSIESGPSATPTIDFQQAVNQAENLRSDQQDQQHVSAPNAPEANNNTAEQFSQSEVTKMIAIMINKAYQEGGLKSQSDHAPLDFLMGKLRVTDFMPIASSVKQVEFAKIKDETGLPSIDFKFKIGKDRIKTSIQGKEFSFSSLECTGITVKIPYDPHADQIEMGLRAYAGMDQLVNIKNVVHMLTESDFPQGLKFQTSDGREIPKISQIYEQVLMSFAWQHYMDTSNKNQLVDIYSDPDIVAALTAGTELELSEKMANLTQNGWKQQKSSELDAELQANVDAEKSWGRLKQDGRMWQLTYSAFTDDMGKKLTMEMVRAGRDIRAHQ